MTDHQHFDRRTFLGTLAGSVGAGLGIGALPPSVQRAMAETAGEPGSLGDVEHVIFLMQENRSFDTYYGTLSGVIGFDDPHATGSKGREVFYQPDPKNPDGYELPFRMNTFTTSGGCAPSLSHSWTAQHHSWNHGAMDNWLPAHRASNGDVRGPLTMGYYVRDDVPFHYALADAFTICDMYFCSVMGPTRPNRLYAQTGGIDPDGSHGGPVLKNGDAQPGKLTWTTYPEALEEAGVSWRMYYQDYGNMLQYFKSFADAEPGSSLYENGLRTRTLDDFAADVAGGRLPQVSWLNASYSDSEHPRFLPANGAMFEYQVLDILARNPDVWASTVLVLTYDENDGYFDHVTPPTPPEGTPGEYVSVDPLPPSANGIPGPIGLGFRVGCIVISPWSQGGWVSHEVFDHISMLRLAERRFGVPIPNVSAWRNATVGDLTSTLRPSPKDTSFPSLPSPEATLERQEQNCGTLPQPTVPTHQTLPHQEQGGRKVVPPISLP